MVLSRGGLQQAVATAAAALARDAARLKAPITGVSVHPELDGVRIDVAPGEAKPVEFPGERFAPALGPMRIAEPFERLRDIADAMPERPRVFLAAIGPLAGHARRVGFAREFFEAAGVASIVDAGGSSAEDAAARFLASGAKIVCLCGADQAYRESAAALAIALKRAGADYALLAGRPGDHEAEWRAAGIDAFIHAGSDAVAALAILLARAGASNRA